jgi:hypothetical protein
MEDHDFAMDDFSPNFPYDIILDLIWHLICRILSLEERKKLFLIFYLISKTWKNLVNYSQGWAHCRFHLLELQFQKQKLLEDLHREPQLKVHEPKSFGNSNDSDG